MSDREDKLRQVLSHLQQVVDHLTPISYKSDADDYNKLVGRLEALGYELEQYKIQPAELYRNDRTKVRPGHELIVQYQVLDRRAKALLMYFTLRNKTVIFSQPPAGSPGC